MNKLFLGIIRLLRPLIGRLGADYEQVVAIVDVKLKLDNRRTYTAFGQYRQNQRKEASRAFWWMLGVYGLFFGPLAAIFLWVTTAQMSLLAFSFSYAVAMLIVAMTLITDFSSVMLDSSDNNIVLPCPVNSRTLLVARLLHITMYLLLISLAVQLASIITVFVQYGVVAGLVFIIFGLLSILLVVFLTNLMYLLLMRFTSEERLREVINYFQIVAAIVFYASYQILPRMMEFIDDSFVLKIRWWHYLLPPVWLGGAVESLVFQKFDAVHLGLVGLAVLMPFIGLWIMNRFLAPLYNQRLATLDTDYRTDKTALRRTDRAVWLSRLVSRNAVEQAAFAFTWRIMLRDRKFKLKAYPAMGYMLVIMALMLWQNADKLLTGGSKAYLLILYLGNLMGMNVLPFVWHSDEYKASWMYAVTPFDRPGLLISGALKAVLVQFCVPVYLFTSVLIVSIVGPAAIGDVLFAASVNATIIIMMAVMGDHRLPFSLPLEQMNQGTKAGVMFLVMIALGLLGAVHYGMTFVPFAVWGGMVLALTASYFMLRNLQQTTRWDSISQG